MSKAFVVGLTGPIGSGKSAVAEIFQNNGYKLIDADKVAREVVKKGSPVLDELSKNFGEDVINEDGTLNRRLLAQKAFSTKDGTALLNSITHPAIVSLVKKRIAGFKAQGFDKIIYDAPLLFESETDKLCDSIVSVIAPKEVRIERVKARDNMPLPEIEKRIKAQHDESYYTEKSNYVIYNNSTLKELRLRTQSVVRALQR
ncbi:MAG: dephospho-CoA kinase [Ruminococcus sp.]|nr:dephospho-CoA kinase [Ruminococcus sp.]